MTSGSGPADPYDPPARRVVLADDHAFFLEGLRDALSARPGLEVVAGVSNGLAAIAAVKRLTPDLAVFDDTMPGATGLEAVSEARRWSPATRFVILTGFMAPARLAEMRAMGLHGILIKSMSPEAICEGIEAVLAGETVLGDGIAGALAGEAAARGLTPRERQVPEGIADGRSMAAIADGLSLSVKTVDSHRTSLMRKLGAHNVASLLVAAIRHGLIDVR